MMHSTDTEEQVTVPVSQTVPDWWRRVITGWIIVFSAIVIYVGTQNRLIADEGKEAHDALCITQASYEGRVARTKAFIKDIREGKRKPIPGITIADMQLSLAEDEKTVKDLNILNC